MKKNIQNILDRIITIPDFPKKGVMFKDITPIFQDPQILDEVIEIFAQALSDVEIDCIAGIESRGFLFGVPLALRLKKPFVLIRKPNKLPRNTFKEKIKLEYGDTTIELQKDDIKPNSKVVIIDDLLATGGTVAGAEKLVLQSKAFPVYSLFLVELNKLKGRKKLKSKVFSIIQS